ncbi:MAG TPA: hypothetical protein VFZ53_18465 [Polyangiaceae bacterium]
MNLKKLTIVPMLAMALFAVGCGADCESLCEDGQECKDAEKVDCAEECEKIEKAVEKAGCEDQYDDVLSCSSDQDDICKPDEDACESEAEAFAKCMAG